MIQNLNKDQLLELIQKVFAPAKADRTLTILLDVPNSNIKDNENWLDRRVLAFEWKTTLQTIKRELGLAEVDLIYYENTGSNNSDLPSVAFHWQGKPELAAIDKLQTAGKKIELVDLLSKTDIIIAPTQFSATAPLKVLAKKHNFRAATMPGFSRQMLPALSVDYKQVHEQVMKLKTRLDDANNILMEFQAESQTYKFNVDLRHRTAHASSGLLRERGVAGNLPSGEAYIVPYEGELADESKTAGFLPVQFGDEIVSYQIKNNRAVDVTSWGKISQKEREKIIEEPAYGNIAEIGFGVLEPFGIKPTGEILIDEKLGLHIAFGRSEHFGGATSPQDFKSPQNVIHIDRIYIREVQDKIEVKEVVFTYPNDRTETVIQNGEYCSL